MNDFFNNTAKVRIDGLNLDKLYKIFKKKGFVISNVKRTTYKQIIFNIKSGQVKRLLATLTQPCYNITIEKYNGVSSIINFLKQRIGILIGVFLLFITVGFASNLTWNIEVYGNDTISTQQIVECLDLAGISIGKGLNLETVEYAEGYLQQNLEKASLVSVIKKGSSVIVNIKEIRTSSVMENIGEQVHLVAEFDGVITSINNIEGTLLVKVGDVVKKGDVLIAGYFYDLNKNQISCIAMGDIFANVWYTESVNFKTVETIMTRTGERQETTNLELFANTISVSNSPSTFTNYEVEETSEYLFENNLLPIKINKTIYWETTPQIIERDFVESETNLISEALELAREKVPLTMSANIKNEFTVIEKNDTDYLILAYIECEIKIAVVSG